MNFFLFDLKKIILIITILTTLFLSIFFFAFLAILLIPLAITLLVFKKFFLSKKNFKKSTQYSSYQNNENNFIDVEYKKHEERDE